MHYHLFLLLTLLLNTNLFAATIHSYQELRAAMHQGKGFTILLDLPRCTGNLEMPTGSFTPSTLLLAPATEMTGERIVTSQLHFSDHMGQPMYEYTKYVFQPDNSVLIRVVFYDPKTFELTGSSHLIPCKLNEGVTVVTRD